MKAGLALAALVALASCGRGDPAKRATGELRKLCAGRFTEQTTRDLRTTGCSEWQDHGRWRAQGTIILDAGGRPVSVRVALQGRSADQRGLRDRALRVVEPLLDARQRAAVRAAVERLGEEALGHERFSVGGATIDAVTELELDRPWERTVTIDVWLVEPRASGDGPVPPAPLPASTMGPMDEAAIAAWKALCRDDGALEAILGFPPGDPTVEPEFRDSAVPHDRWNLGDVWLRCSVGHRDQPYGGHMIVDAVWNPDTRALLLARVSVAQGRADAHAVLLERLTGPLLSPPQRARVDQAARFAIPYRDASSADGVRVWSDHYRDAHEVVLRAP